MRTKTLLLIILTLFLGIFLWTVWKTNSYTGKVSTNFIYSNNVLHTFMMPDLKHDNLLYHEEGDDRTYFVRLALGEEGTTNVDTQIQENHPGLTLIPKEITITTYDRNPNDVLRYVDVNLFTVHKDYFLNIPEKDFELTIQIIRQGTPRRRRGTAKYSNATQHIIQDSLNGKSDTLMDNPVDPGRFDYINLTGDADPEILKSDLLVKRTLEDKHYCYVAYFPGETLVINQDVENVLKITKTISGTVDPNGPIYLMPVLLTNIDPKPEKHLKLIVELDSGGSKTIKRTGKAKYSNAKPDKEN